MRKTKLLSNQQREMGSFFGEHIGAEVAQAGDTNYKIPICRRAKNAMQKWRRSLQIDSVSRICMDWTYPPTLGFRTHFPTAWVADWWAMGRG